MLPPADNRDRLAAEEKAVAGRAGRDPGAAEQLLGGQAKPARLRPRGKDQRVGSVDGPAIAFRDEGPLAEIEPGDHVIDELGADMPGLLRHLLHQPRALDRFGEAGVVLDLGRDGELAAGLHSLDEKGRQTGAGGIDRRGVAGRPAAQDQHTAMDGLRHERCSNRGLHICVGAGLCNQPLCPPRLV